jgi:hypothetical protein
MREEIIGYLCIWSLLGYFIGPTMSIPKNRKQALIQLFLCGPLMWVMFIPISIIKLLRRAK